DQQLDQGERTARRFHDESPPVKCRHTFFGITISYLWCQGKWGKMSKMPPRRGMPQVHLTRCEERVEAFRLAVCGETRNTLRRKVEGTFGPMPVRKRCRQPACRRGRWSFAKP